MKKILRILQKTTKSLFIVFLSLIVGLQATQATLFAQEITTDDLTSIVQGIEKYDPNSQCEVGDNSVSTGAGLVDDVYVLGDSITRAAKAEYESKFSDKGINVFVNGLDSRTVSGGPEPSGIDALDIDAETIKTADVIVIALGTNVGSFSNENVAAMIDKIRDPNGINSQSPIYWVDTVNFSNLGATKSSNEIIYAQAGAKGFSVISLFKAVSPSGDPQNPTDTADTNMYLDGDKVHLSGTGTTALVNLVVDTVSGSGTSQAITPTPTETPSEGESENTESTSGALSIANNTSYNGEQIWTDDLLAKVEENRPFYEKAAQKAGIPWAMIAIVHKHETGLGRINDTNGQGIYQDVQRLNGPYPAGPVSDEEFQRQTDWAAELIKKKAQSNPEGLQDLANSDTIKETFWGYNGKADSYRRQAAALGFDPDKQGFEGSPYVMNKADARRDPNTAAPGTWGQIKEDFGPIVYPANQHFGSWVMYAAIAGLSTGSATPTCEGTGVSEAPGGSPSAQKIIDIARRELEAGANAADRSYHKYSMGRSEAWCADFVSWVLREAGTPFTEGNDGWNIPAVISVLNWFKKHGEFNPNGDYTPRPGDVVIMKNGILPYRSHVNFVVAVNGDEITTIGGNESNTIRERTHNKNAAYITGYGTKIGGEEQD